jgi:uncharacterized membrane protein
MTMTPETPAADAVAQASARINSAHFLETGRLQHAMDRLTAMVGMPAFVALLTVAIAAWTLGNGVVALLGYAAIDPPPFALLEAMLPVAGLYVAALILTTQRRQEQLAGHRGQLVLELAILNDQKVSKIIALLEEARRDNPLISNRVDGTARAMSTPSDPHSVLEAIKEVQEKQS